MNTGEDEPSPSLNARLRPRKSATTPSPQNKNVRKTEGKLAQDRPKRTSILSKASPSKQDDLATKSDSSSAPLFLCPFCDRKFNARQTVSKHARRIHLSKQDNFIKCLYCNHSDAESHAIIKHMVDSHPNQYFACMDCHTRFSSTTELAEHKLNVCEKQKPPYRSKLRQKTSAGTKKNSKKIDVDEKNDSSNENTQYTDDRGFSGIVISCELKPTETHDAADIEDKITTNLILPHSKSLGTGREKNAVIVLDDLQWNKRIPPNFSFHNTDADQILSRLGVVHRSPRVGESRKDLIRMMDEPNEKFEKCFDTSFYSKVAKNVQDNLARYLDGSFNFNPNRDTSIKTRKSKTSVVINTAEGFPILLAHEQFSRNLVDGFIPRTMTPKHKWKWDTADNDKNLVMLLDQTKRDSHNNNCIITLISSLDIWTQLRMKSKFEGIFKTTPTAKKTEKQNIISMELKEILESRDIPTTSTQIACYTGKSEEVRERSDLPAYLGLSPTTSRCELQPAVLSGEWVRPRCYVCCACGEQTRDARALSTHLTSQHPNAQVQHYEIVGETLLSADILKHLYVPPSQISNRTRPPRGFKDCTKCKKSITLEDLHQHMLDCAGDTPTVRRKCRYRPFGVRRRRPRLPDNTIRKKMRKAISSRHRKKTHMRPRPKIRTEVGDAETIRKMIADLPAKRNRISPSNVLRPRRNVLKAKKPAKLRAPESKRSNKTSAVKTLRKLKESENTNKQNDTDNSSTVDEDDQPLKLSATRASTRSANCKKAVQCRATITKTRKKKQSSRKDPNMRGFQSDYYNYEMLQGEVHPNMGNPMFNNHMLPRNLLRPEMLRGNVFRPGELATNMYPTYHPYYFPNQLALEHPQRSHLSREAHQHQLEQAHHVNCQMALKQAHDNHMIGQVHQQLAIQYAQQDQLTKKRPQRAQAKQHPVVVVPQEPHNQLFQEPQIQMDQELHIQLPRGSHSQVLQGTPNQLPQALHNDLTQEPHNHLAPVPQNQLIIDDSHQRVDVHGAGPSNIRQHGNRDDKNMDGGKNPPVGGGNDGNQNNIAQVPNVPLKHSIASLTSHTDLRNTTSQCRHSYLLPSKISKTPMRESMDNRQDFENEESAEKLDKPPLPNDLIESKTLNEVINYSTHDSDGQVSSLNDMAESRNVDSKQLLSNDPVEMRASEERERAPSRNNSIASTETGGSSLSNLGESEETQRQIVFPNSTIVDKDIGEKTPVLNEPKGSLGMNDEQIKIENDKKLNRNRKGLNDCIAMLRTKKGLRHDQATNKCGDNVSLDSEITVTTKISNPSATTLKTIEENKPENNINLTPAQVFSRSTLSEQFQQSQSGNYAENIIQCVPTDHLSQKIKSAPIDNLVVEHRKASVDSQFESSYSKQYKVKREIPRARSLSHSEYEKASHVEAMQTESALFVKPSPRQPTNINSGNELTMRRNSVDGLPVLDDSFYHHRFGDSAKTLIPRNVPHLSPSVLRAQDKQIDIKQLQFNQRIVNEIRKQQNTSPVHFTPEKEKIDSMTDQQLCVSPTSRRTRRKPVKKNPIFEQQPAFVYERSKRAIQKKIADKNTAVSPQHHSPYKNLVMNPKEPSVHTENANFLSPGTPAVETPLKTSPSSRVRRESQKRVLNSPETSANAFQSQTDVSQNKMFKKSPEGPTENFMNIQNLRRHSIELANAQNIALNNYDLYMRQAYREHNEKALLEMSPLSRGFSQSRPLTQNELSQRQMDDNVRHDRSNELHSRYSTFVLTTHDTHGIMHVNPESVKSDVAKKAAPIRGPQDDHQKRFENEQLKRKIQATNVQKHTSNNTEVKMDNVLKVGGPVEQKRTSQEFKSNESNVMDNNLHRLEMRRSSGDYYTRSSPYQSNIQNLNKTAMSNRSLEMVPVENSVLIDNSLRVYHDSVASFRVPPSPFPNNTYCGISLQPIPCQSNAEVTPLDLSCDPKYRLDKVLDYNSPELFNRETPIANETCADALMPVNFQSDYSEEQRNVPQHLQLPFYKPETEQGRELVHKTTHDVLYEQGDDNITNEDISTINRKNITLIQGNNHNVNTDIALSRNFEISNYSLYESSQTHPLNKDTNRKNINTDNVNRRSPDKSLLTSPVYDYYTSRQISTFNTKPNYRQESMQEKTFLENKKIARSTLTKGSHNVKEAVNTPPTDILIPIAENVDQYESCLNMDHRIASPNMPTQNTNETSHQSHSNLEAKPGEIPAQSSNQDIENDQMSCDPDAETARKFAMLPEELVKILGTIPKDHRNQLLNVLPQYVTPISAAGQSTTKHFNATVVNENSSNQQMENKPLPTVSVDSNRLSVNTTISPSSIIPKKRHSPSQQSRGRLDSNEIQTTTGLRPSLMPTLPQSCSTSRDEKSNNSTEMFSEKDYFVENMDSEHSRTYTGLVTRRSFEKERDDAEINVVDFGFPENIRKSNDSSTPAGIAYISPVPSQDLTYKPPPKIKNSTEQTASLRAVRIKPTSSKKSFSDEKNILANFTYKTNVSGDGDNTNPAQIVNPQLHSYRNISEFKYDKMNLNPLSKNDYNDEMLQVSTGQNTNHDSLQRDSSFVVQNNNMVEEKNDGFILNLCSPVSQREDYKSHKTIQVSNQFNEPSTLEPSSTANFQTANKDIDHFLGQMSSITFLDGDHSKEQKLNVVSLSDESKEELPNAASSVLLCPSNEDLRTQPTTSPFEVIESTNRIEKEEIHFQRPIVTCEKIQDLLLQSTENDNALLKYYEASPDRTSTNNLISGSDDVIENTQTKALSPKEVDSNEEDSDDDVTLAVIKLKHCAQPLITETDAAEITTRQSSSASLNKEKRNRLKVTGKHRKKKVSKKLDTRISKQTESGIDINIVIEPSENDISFNDKEVKGKQNKKEAKTLPPIGSVVTIDKDKLNNEISEFDVNKENNITENVNKIKEDDLSILPECNQIECQVDNHIDKNVENAYLETPNVNMEIGQQSEEKKTATADEINVVPDVIASCHFKIIETCESVNDNLPKQKKIVKNSNKTEIECVDLDIGTKNVSNVCTSDIIYGTGISASHLMPDDLKDNRLSQGSIKDSNVSDIELCAEISEKNSLPLRRSRRGKSMYADSGCLDDIEHIIQVEDVNKKAPLTMKRLILSRVEKDKKRVSECSTAEKNSHTIDEIDLNDSEKANNKKGKIIKRKKSPSSRRKSKKIKKSTSVHQLESDFSDHSDINSASESNTSILRELPYAKNKIGDIDTSQEEEKFNTNSDNTASLTGNSISIDNEKVSEVSTDNLIEAKESNVSGKRKSNTLKITDLVTKSKKTKYHKKKPQSDFDSDDDKVLLETKLKIAAEKHSLVDDDPGTAPEKEETDAEISNFTNEASNNNIKQSADANVAVETRVTCYNRQSSNRRPRSSSASIKDSANYDPYDIDFEDMVESSAPITKKKSKNVSNIHSAKIHNETKTSKAKSNETSTSLIKLSKQAKKTISSISIESDSDSSKSDVPLQKYVDEKALDSEHRNKNNKEDSIEDVDMEKDTLTHKNVSPQQNLDSKGKKSIKRVCKSNSLRESETQRDTVAIDHNTNTNNNSSENETTQKQQNKEKKTRRMHTAPHADSNNASSEVDQQLLSDKFMENFGFYSEKIPRKSNLLASKKISETFHNMVSNEIEDYGYKEKSSKRTAQNEHKKKPETSSEISVLQDSKPMTDDATNSHTQSTGSETVGGETLTMDKTSDEIRSDDNDHNGDDVTAQNVMKQDEEPTLENVSIAALKETAEANTAPNIGDVNYPHSSNFDTIGPDINPNTPVDQTEKDGPKINELTETTKKSNKNSKAVKQLAAGIRNKMYPDIEEIDMLEDKFDKIKRKRRSQAVAAKQIQSIAEINASVKSRKRNEKKRPTKNPKKNNQSTQVPTKGALKGFEGIKISIPTQDLNMPPCVSPPRQQKKRKKVSGKRRKEASESESSCSEIEKEKSGLEKDIYEFKDSEDTELFELRPSTVMDRFRSMHNKTKFKHKEREKGKGDIEKEKHKTKDKEKKIEFKEKEVIIDRVKAKEQEKYPDVENDKRQKKSIPREEGDCLDMCTHRDLIAEQLNLKEINGKLLENAHSKTTQPEAVNDGICTKTNKFTVTQASCTLDEDRSKKETDNAVASTSGFVPDRMDESDYESELSSPEGEFIFYTSDDVNCVCPSDNDSDESDIEKGCGRLNCLYKNRNADKNAAIGNIFKNNAVRCEKTDTKEPEKPRPNLDQLFDSLFEIKPSNSVRATHEKEVVPVQTVQYLTLEPSTTSDPKKIVHVGASPVSHYDRHKSKQEQTVASNKEIASVCEDSFKTSSRHEEKVTNKSKNNINKKIVADKNETSKYNLTSNNELMSDSDSLHIFTIDKIKNNFGYSLVSEECTQVNFADIIADEIISKNGGNQMDASKADLAKAGAKDQLDKYNSEDDFDINEPESLTRQYMHLVLPADKASSCAQTEQKSDNSDVESENESAASKYLKGLSPSEAAKLEIYTMVCAQSTQTVKPDENDLSQNDDFSRSKSEDEVDLPIVERGRIRLQKYDISEITHKSKSSKSIQTEKNKSCKTSQHDAQVESDDDNILGELTDHALKEPDPPDVPTCVFNEGVLPLEDAVSFATPASRPTADKHSPRKSDEGISTSHDYSADAFDQTSFEDTGVARQRARRKCTVGKQNVLAEHWSSESEFDGAPPRPNSADSVVANVSRKKKTRKKEGHHSGGRKGNRHSSKNEGRSSGKRTASGGRSDDSDSCAGPSRAPPGPKIRARPAHHYWSSDGEDTSGPQPQHGWIVGDSHKKLVTMLAHAKGRKRSNADKYLD